MCARRPVGLRVYRIAADLDQAELAEKVGVTRQLIAKLEAGRILPRLDLARKLADALGADVDQLFPDHDQAAVS